MKTEPSTTPPSPYTEKAVFNFLYENFANNPTMRWRLTNLINGVREYEREKSTRTTVKQTTP